MTQTPSPYEGAPAARNPEAVDSGDRYRPDDTSQPSMKDSTTESSKNTVATEAGKVAETGVQAAKDVAGTAKQEASNVVAETKQQARSLFESVRDEVAAQGGTQQQRLAASLHSISEELGGLAAGSQQPGPVTVGSTTYTFTAGGAAGSFGGSGNATFFAATGSTTTADTANYAIFSGLSGASQTITVDIPQFGGLAGFQVVQVPEPATLALTGCGAALMALRRRRR